MRRVANTEPDLVELIDTVQAGAEAPTWAVDLADGPAALVTCCCSSAASHSCTCPESRSNRAADAYHGEGNTDAKDAAIIANQAGMRRDLRVLRLDEPAPSETTISGLAAVAVPVPSKSRVVRIAV